MFPIVRGIILGLAAVRVAVLAYLAFNPDQLQRSSEATVGTPEIGGPFSMVAHSGETVTDRTYAGKAWLMFVG